MLAPEFVGHLRMAQCVAGLACTQIEPGQSNPQVDTIRRHGRYQSRALALRNISSS
jgi:hypothetical protein